MTKRISQFFNQFDDSCTIKEKKKKNEKIYELENNKKKLNENDELLI
jgi:hypothetical protein